MSNRKATEAFILEHIGMMTKSKHTTQLYAARFAEMNDTAFDAFMKRLKSGEEKLAVYDPNFSDGGLDVEKNIAIAKKLGHDFFEPLVYETDGIIPAHTTPIKFMVVDLPVRRASQSIVKKARVPPDNKIIDMLTGQPTGASKGAKITTPELQYCAAMGLDNTLLELMKYRGGDVGGNNAYRAMMAKYGTADFNALKPYATGVESTKTMKVFFTGAHLKSNL